MKIISHRGNISGPNKDYENKPSHIINLLNSYDVEIDVWKMQNGLFLGHDIPQYPIGLSFLEAKGLWCHCKNIEALEFLSRMDINCFWHENDQYTLTSKKFIWTYPDIHVPSIGIIVDLSKNWKEKNYNCLGVCVDYL